MTRRRLAVIAGAIAVAAIAGATFAVATRVDGKADAADLPLFEAPSTTAAPTTTASTSTTIALPIPEPPPTDAYADVPVVEIGRIAIPALGLDHALYEGVWLTVLDHGPGHWPGSALPGEIGNAVFPGHRVTHSRPFYDLDLLAPGDEVTFHVATGDFTYAVTETLIVSPTDLWVIDQTEERTMTLVACHPKHSARQRIVVKGTLVRSHRTPQTPASTTTEVAR